MSKTKKKIKEIERVSGYKIQQGFQEVSLLSTDTGEELMDKINEIIKYLNEK